MNRPLPILLAFLATLPATSQVVLIDEDFDAHNTGDMLVQNLGAPWATWSGTMAEDVPLTDETAASGSLSAKFFSTSANGGPGDIILGLGNRTSGSYSLSWSMFINAGFGGYYNIQHNENPGAGSWALDLIFHSNGTIQYSANVTGTLFTYPQDEWFSVAMTIDLDSYAGTLVINGDPAGTWATDVQSNGNPGPNQIGGINFYPYAGGNLTYYYIDDVSFIDLLGTGVEETALSRMGVYPVPTADVVWVELPTLSTAAVASLMDATGRVLIEGQRFGTGGGVARTAIDLAGLPSGVYLLRVQLGDQEVVRRISKG